MTTPPLTRSLIVGMVSLGTATLITVLGFLFDTTNKLNVSVGRLIVQVEALEHRDARLAAVERRVGSIERRGRWHAP